MPKILDFLNWFVAHHHKVFIAGNHDFFLNNVVQPRLTSAQCSCCWFITGLLVGGLGYYFGQRLTEGEEEFY